jgi:hypothetical protein
MVVISRAGGPVPAKANPGGRKWPWTALQERLRAWVAERRRQRRFERFKKARAFSRRWLLLWNSAHSVAPEDRSRLAGQFCRVYSAVYRREVVGDRLGKLFLGAILLSTATYFLLLPYLLGYPPGSYVVVALFALIGSYTLLMALVFLVMLPLYYLRSPWAVTGLPAVSISTIILSSTSIALAILDAAKIGDPILITGLGVLGIVLPILCGYLLTWVALSFANHWARSRSPDELMAEALLLALKNMEVAGEKWTSVESRLRVARLIAVASEIARTSLFRKFTLSDAGTRAWAAGQANAIAAALAEKQRWLMTPKADTYDFLLAKLSRSVVALLSGAWDELERANPEDAAQAQYQGVSRSRWVARVLLRSLQAISVAALPAALFWLARWRGLLSNMDPKVLDYVEIGVVVWAALILAFMLDPQLKEKISTLKEVTSVLNPWAKKE